MKNRGMGFGDAAIGIILIPIVGICFLYSGCAPPPEVAVARVITAMMTKSQILALPQVLASPSVSPTVSIPVQISCNTDIYTFNSGTNGSESVLQYFPVAKPTTYEIETAIIAHLNVSGAGFPNTSSTSTSGSSSTSSTDGSSAAYTVNCTFFANFSIDTQNYLYGSGTIPSCEDYECIVNNEKIDCDKLQTAMATTTCQ